MMTLPRWVWAVAVLVTAIAFGLSPLLVPDFGGFDADAFPIPQDDPPVQPSGYAFAIWGLIYLWLAVSAVFGLIARRDAVDWHEMRPALTLSLGVGATWLVAAKASPLAATVLIWVMLLSALLALFRAPLLDRWWAQAPVAIYAGWLSAASFVALGLVLAGYGLMSETGAALLCISLATLCGATVQIKLDGAPEYGATLVWAFLAIVLANLLGPGVVLALALLATALMTLLAIRAVTIQRSFD